MKPPLTLAAPVAAIIRAASFMYGGFVILASIPVALLGGAAPSDTVPMFSPLLTVPLAAAVLVSGFLYIAVLGARMRKAQRHRVIAGALLMLPIAVGASILLSPGHPEMRPEGIFFFLPACVAFLCTVWPWRLACPEI